MCPLYYAQHSLFYIYEAISSPTQNTRINPPQSDMSYITVIPATAAAAAANVNEAVNASEEPALDVVVLVLVSGHSFGASLSTNPVGQMRSIVRPLIGCTGRPVKPDGAASDARVQVSGSA